MRNEGWYFVKLKKQSAWHIAEYTTANSPKGCWFMIHTHKVFYDSDFNEIDERSLSRDRLDLFDSMLETLKRASYEITAGNRGYDDTINTLVVKVMEAI